jgi:phosphohistidine phosphatase
MRMNTIYLLRHAEAESPAYYEDDHDRELTMEGQRDARRLGQFLSATDQLPDQFISSTAVRARRTAELLPEGGQWMVEVPFRSTHALYQAQPADVLDEIQSVDSNVRAIMLVGHEPAWSTTVGHLLGSATVSLPAGTCVRIDTQTNWSQVEFGDGVLRWMIPPTLLR